MFVQLKAVDLLLTHPDALKKKWEFTPVWGCDLASEHERFLTVSNKIYMFHIFKDDCIFNSYTFIMHIFTFRKRFLKSLLS